ncbi:hypothetical protein PsYK624_129450 [Phanerochaete sordida]|uniref:Uncharacterized protein n=1 Tax=Phanerochaete sordida TaxID=48140 RepID=A0A9P3GNR1_9APHY|nr:hypothetical protein PsYK624_129450 [Phanerochaete sordida]
MAVLQCTVRPFLTVPWPTSQNNLPEAFMEKFTIDRDLALAVHTLHIYGEGYRFSSRPRNTPSPPAVVDVQHVQCAVALFPKIEKLIINDVDWVANSADAALAGNPYHPTVFNSHIFSLKDIVFTRINVDIDAQRAFLKCVVDLRASRSLALATCSVVSAEPHPLRTPRTRGVSVLVLDHVHAISATGLSRNGPATLMPEVEAVKDLRVRGPLGRWTGSVQRLIARSKESMRSLSIDIAPASPDIQRRARGVHWTWFAWPIRTCRALVDFTIAPPNILDDPGYVWTWGCVEWAAISMPASVEHLTICLEGQTENVDAVSVPNIATCLGPLPWYTVFTNLRRVRAKSLKIVLRCTLHTNAGTVTVSWDAFLRSIVEDHQHLAPDCAVTFGAEPPLFRLTDMEGTLLTQS